MKFLPFPHIMGSAFPGTNQDIHVKQTISRKEIWLTYIALLATLVSIALVGWEQSGIIMQDIAGNTWVDLSVHILFLTIIAFLIYGGMLYQFTRIGYFKRKSELCPASDADLDELYREDAPTLSILIPSYKEDLKVIMQTMMSAALQDYPKKRVVLLIDDDPEPSSNKDRALLSAARKVPVQLDEMFSSHRERFMELEKEFLQRESKVDLKHERNKLSAIWLELASWFEQQASNYVIHDHTDQLFVDKVYHALRESCNIRAEKISLDKITDISNIRTEYRRLASMFDVELTSFERKRFLNLSHEPNKAMNLNSYIGLSGGHFREQKCEQGLLLRKCEASGSQLSVPDTDFFITLDADSLILHEYASRLIHFMRKSGNERVAVAQTPYSAIKGADNLLERIAGATTDIQYIIHQGFTHFNATYWVGANALIRATALQDIKTVSIERGYEVTRYIHDRTVIEDTESSVDLADKGWTLFNYPERLAYSATPPDFGSLLIQRRRWANGGLIILPKLLRYLLRAPLSRAKEGFFRIHYLISIAAVNIGLLMLLAFPFGDMVNSVWLPLTALPYFVLYARDLKQCGYKISDLFRVYALNLLMIPINLGGVFKSIEQAITGKQIPFGRTPKIQGRTAASPLYILAVYVLFFQWCLSGIFTISVGHYALGVFALINSMFLLYAIINYVGLQESRQDLAVVFATTERRAAIEAA